VVIRFAFFNAYHHRIAYFLHNGGFEYAALAVWKQRAANATTIYDLGGFNSMYGLLAAKINPKARVLIFEPDPMNARHIRAPSSSYRTAPQAPVSAKGSAQMFAWRRSTHIKQPISSRSTSRVRKQKLSWEGKTHSATGQRSFLKYIIGSLQRRKNRCGGH
jgi:hypothetical protein